MGPKLEIRRSKQLRQKVASTRKLSVYQMSEGVKFETAQPAEFRFDDFFHSLTRPPQALWRKRLLVCPPIGRTRPVASFGFRHSDFGFFVKPLCFLSLPLGPELVAEGLATYVGVTSCSSQILLAGAALRRRVRGQNFPMLKNRC